MHNLRRDPSRGGCRHAANPLAGPLHGMGVMTRIGMCACQQKLRRSDMCAIQGDAARAEVLGSSQPLQTSSIPREL